jgi:hydroxyacylglutathione hydrolase
VPSQASRYPGAPIYGGSDKVPALTHLVKDKDELKIGDDILVKYLFFPASTQYKFDTHALFSYRCLATPCHTRDSICYYATSSSHPGGVVFTGDTLFVGGCGRLFEGTPAEMHAALSYLGTLSDETVVYDGHEYTAGSLAFARSVEPGNAALGRLEEVARERQERGAGETGSRMGLSTIGDEKEWNVFMRVGSEAMRYVLIH